ncbi:MAG: PilZ domain-containing protein [Nitrospirae bacterium]|nr:PilZ domain-containing protein [Nitrospirota bacterium]
MERRKTNRIIKRLEVKFHTGIEKTAITSDLSEAGMFIRTNQGVAPGSIISIKLCLSNSQEIFLSGKVIRSMRTMSGLIGETKSGMGIELVNPPPNYTDYVQSILA